MAAQGNATVNFGASPTTSAEAMVNVTGQSALAATSQIEAWIQGTDSTVDHTGDEHQVEDLQVFVVNLLPGVGFTIGVRCRNGLTSGQYVVEWIWV